ncbi:NAD(P)-dependent oxidoreductase [Sphaerotilus sp.]|uniref:NAD(P)-dependent oxidoreductase n=1 Tax=Sphaerotilus sp. TaxID=2093942 RepID=UPI002ACF024E|nr:NAD(P)-dependent oxidoreductase [Sphaerotilus sp.]MDZ7856512.1 NAD(P)-dependent oxidoreductase [Sphaerotilus sp.]
MADIGFIGASGMMGHGMARNLQARGHTLRLTLRQRREPVADLLAAGAVEAASPAELARACEVVFLCVTGSPEVEAVLGGADGVLAGARPGLVVVDCSTSEPASTARLREQAAAAGVVLVDAPLGRSPVQAEAGMLNVMVGAEPEVFARIEPLLRCFAENVFHVGGPGAGHTVKLLNNFIAQAICNATAEALGVAARAGLDPKKLIEVISGGPVNCGLIQMMAPALDGRLDGLKFSLDNARKDVRYYGHLAEGLGVPAWIGQAVHQSLVQACVLGYGDRFVPSLIEAQEQLNGVALVPRPTPSTPT